MNKYEEMKRIIKDINLYNYHYYVLDNPLISDKEWDKLYDKLLLLEKETGKIFANSPTQKVGGQILKGFKKVNHQKKLYSLNKANNFESLEKWLNDMRNFGVKRFNLEYKFDGLRILVSYKNGKIVQCATRGNGTVGEDVTQQILTIKTLPHEINFKGDLVVMGEAMIRKSTLENYNKTAKEPLKNPRNAAAGAIRNLDINVARSRQLELILYDVLSISSKEFNTQSQMHQFLINNGFFVWDYFKTLDSNNEIKENIKRIDEIKNKLDILIDGAVVKVDDLVLRDEIGYTSKFPKWAIAYKFEAVESVTQVKNIIWQVGRTGKLTPIAEIEPIELAGAIVKRATLNNYGDIKRKDIKINSNVFVRRSNEVIPEILGIESHTLNSVEIEKPTYCPSCNSVLTKKGANLFCLNKTGCSDQIEDKIIHFCSRNAMNIEGISEKTAQMLRNKLNVYTFADLYNLTKEQLLTLNGFKDKKSENLINAIQKSKKVNFSNFIYALGINGVGEKIAKDLAKNFKTLNDLISATPEDFLKIYDIGVNISENISNYFQNNINLSILKELLDVGIIISYASNKAVFKKGLTDKNFVLTGTLEKYTRDEATKILESFGAKIQSSVSSHTDYVLVGENAGSKLEKAKKLNIEIINQKQFENMISE